MSFLSGVSSTVASAPLKPGTDIAVTLQSVKVSTVNPETGKGQAGNLLITFKGTDPSNNGVSTITIWASTFDPEGKYYQEWAADKAKRQLVQLLEAFATPAEIATINATDSLTTFNEIVRILTPHFGKPATVKLVYAAKSDTNLDLPSGDFISTPLAQRALVLNLDLNSKGLPFDRVKPLAEYGIVAPAANALPGQAGALPGSFPAAGIPAAAPAPMSRPVPTAAPAAPVATPTSEPAFGAPSVQ